MDFVVSKVAMAACALLAATVLAGALNPSKFIDIEDELDCMLSDFCRLAERVGMSGSVMSVLWEVPYLASGDAARIEISDGTVTASSGDRRVLAEPGIPLHTWSWDGGPLNASEEALLDCHALGLVASSGSVISVVSCNVQYENDSKILVFVQEAT